MAGFIKPGAKFESVDVLETTLEGLQKLRLNTEMKIQGIEDELELRKALEETARIIAKHFNRSAFDDEFPFYGVTQLFGITIPQFSTVLPHSTDGVRPFLNCASRDLREYLL